MSFKSTLKNIWEAVAYSPSHPVPEVRQRLEQKGYKYTDETDYRTPAIASMAGMYPVPLRRVFNQQGQRVDYYNGNDDASAQYRKDYDGALAAYKASQPR